MTPVSSLVKLYGVGASPDMIRMRARAGSFSAILLGSYQILVRPKLRERCIASVPRNLGKGLFFPLLPDGNS